MSLSRNSELPGAYQRTLDNRNGGRSYGDTLPSKSSRHLTTSYKGSTGDLSNNSYSYGGSEAGSRRSRSFEALHGMRIGNGSSVASYGNRNPISDGKRTISMGAHLRSELNPESGRKRATMGSGRSIGTLDSYGTSQRSNTSRPLSGSVNSSLYSSTESFLSNDQDDAHPTVPPKSNKFSTLSSSVSDRFYPNPMGSSTTGTMRSVQSDATDTTITSDINQSAGFEDLAEYFNKKLEDVQRQTEQVKGETKGKKKKKRGRNKSIDDNSSLFSYSRGPPGGGSYLHRNKTPGDNSTIRMTTRANGTLNSQATSISHRTGQETEKSRLSSQMTDTSLLDVRQEIEGLKSQISKSLSHAAQGKSGTIDDMVDFYGKRLEECQKQVYEAVSKVQSEAGEIRGGYNESSRRGRNRNRRGTGMTDDDSVYESSDSGIDAKNRTFRAPARPQRVDALRHESKASDNVFSSPSSKMSHTLRNRSYNNPPPLAPRNDEMSETDSLSTVDLPPLPVNYGGELPLFEDGDDDESLGSDDEEDWDDFEDFIDDDTPAPETSIPVPKITFKKTNYVYQTIYSLYIFAFLAYVFVRIQFTLDAPGLNRIYCIVVAALEIITAPSLILQGFCLWRWVSRDPPPTDAFHRPKFHTARIMVPTYKEPLEVVAGTIHEILHMDLPPHFHVHVYVLDDGRRENLEKWVISKLTKRRMHLHYVARPKLPGVPHHAKAGNINHTLHYIFDDAYAERECVIIFDADFMPRRNYLLQVLPVFSEKRSRPIGLVQTPQFFYNVNPDEDVWDHLNVSFFHRIEPSLDKWSAVNCCGTNFVVRADALKDVGYFPVGCLTEDTLLSLRLCTMGWGVAYHHEVLAIGQSPHEITEIFKQRSRWCKGNLQIFLEEFPLMQSGLSLTQRIFYSSCGFNYFCASLSIPFFQLVPAWAIFFGLWPVSKIGLEFAFSFFIYYILGNILLLFPPPGFSIRDMWNGELASTNLWFTYFNGVRRIVGSKLLKGRGELTFKTTKKKTEDDEDGNNVGFQKEDVRACYMHFIMFSIMLFTIIFAIIKATIATDVKFYFYYMYMIGMSWALINMTPYLIVVIYCWYRVRIPGLVVACFRNVQLLLRLVCAGLIMVQAFTTRNLTENFVCPHAYTAELGISPLAMIETLDVESGLQVNRNSFWLLGLKDDFYTIQQIKMTACNEDEVPVIVFFMHPAQGLALDAEAGHYMPDQRIDTWEEYDELIEKYSKELQDVPSLIVMEPSLLMHTYNSKTEYHNTDYQISFTQRVHKVVESFPNSWVYVDAGNAMYLQWQVNLDRVITVMKQMPQTIRGFSINVGSFVNTTFNEQLASEIHCQTGLHFIIDTSRNGGEFSSRPLEQINECTYDPPSVSNGTRPSFMEGATVKTLSADLDKKEPSETEETATGATTLRRKRWTISKPDSNAAVYYEGDPKAGSKAGGEAGSDYEESYGVETDSSVCVTSEATGLDAYTWVKTPGESDGRLFTSGTYHPCLLNHLQECSETCPQYVPKIFGDFQRPPQCTCAS